MDWTALGLSLRLAFFTVLLLVPLALWLGRWLALAPLRGKGWIEGLLAMPLVLPPTVLGFWLLMVMGADGWLGQLWEGLSGRQLAFSFEAILLASLIVNLPFAVQPVQRAFERIDPHLLDAAACCGMSPWQSFVRIQLPLVWSGVLSGAVMTFAHTLGEFGVILMVGGNIPGETQTLAIAIYDRVQMFDNEGAARMSLLLIAVAVVAIGVSYLALGRERRRG